MAEPEHDEAVRLCRLWWRDADQREFVAALHAADTSALVEVVTSRVGNGMKFECYVALGRRGWLATHAQELIAAWHLWRDCLRAAATVVEKDVLERVWTESLVAATNDTLVEALRLPADEWDATLRLELFGEWARRRETDAIESDHVSISRTTECGSE